MSNKLCERPWLLYALNVSLLKYGGMEKDKLDVERLNAFYVEVADIASLSLI
jgi:hypothetical protein